MAILALKNLQDACDHFFSTLYNIVTDSCNVLDLDEEDIGKGLTYKVGWVETSYLYTWDHTLNIEPLQFGNGAIGSISVWVNKNEIGASFEPNFPKITGLLQTIHTRYEQIIFAHWKVRAK